MRTYEDTFSGDKIYPGKVRAVPNDYPQDPVMSFAPAVISSIHKPLTESFNLQGKLYVRGDSKIFRFQNGKTESLFLQRKNPRRIAWTTLYRRQHKKGISEVSARNRYDKFPRPSYQTNDAQISQNPSKNIRPPACLISIIFLS
jgi:large subunit ribosomal protein L24e